MHHLLMDCTSLMVRLTVTANSCECFIEFICRSVITKCGQIDIIRQAAECLPSDFSMRKQFAVVLKCTYM